MSLIQPNIQRVKYWDEDIVHIIIDNVNYSPLAYSMLLGTPYVPNTSSATVPFFKNIYVPVKIPTADGMPEDFTYVNIGVTPVEMADIYATEFGLNFLIEPLDRSDFQDGSQKLGNRIKSVYIKNLGKYMKMLELQGYTYNPLWNVDGTEEYAFLENNGVNDVESQINVYDASLRDFQKTTYVHNNAKNGTADYNAGTDVWENTVSGGDKYHTEKRVRQGNIGVTKTQELIASERENLRFTILDEFFKDINKQILIPIY